MEAWTEGEEPQEALLEPAGRPGRGIPRPERRLCGPRSRRTLVGASLCLGGAVGLLCQELGSPTASHPFRSRAPALLSPSDGQRSTVELLSVPAANRSAREPPSLSAANRSAPELAPLAAGNASAEEGAPRHAVVHDVYTYGAPATAASPIENLQSGDGCFRGLRTYCEDVLGPITKEVDAASISNFYPHAKMATAVLHSHANSTFVPCPGRPTWPTDKRGDVFADWRIHWEDQYAPRLKSAMLGGGHHIGEAPFAKAYLYVLLAFKTYDSTARAKSALRARMPGWRLVGHETRVSGWGALYNEDPVLLAQNSETLDCALAIAGINYFGSEVAVALEMQGADYCGFRHVHKGYSGKLRELTRDVWPRLRPKLQKCGKISCVGHSMGGAMCELFAACANSGRARDPDYRLSTWVPGTPEQMSWVDGGGVAYGAGAERRCGAPPCGKVGFG